MLCEWNSNDTRATCYQHNHIHYLMGDRLLSKGEGVCHWRISLLTGSHWCTDSRCVHSECLYGKGSEGISLNVIYVGLMFLYILDFVYDVLLSLPLIALKIQNQMGFKWFMEIQMMKNMSPSHINQCETELVSIKMALLWVLLTNLGQKGNYHVLLKESCGLALATQTSVKQPSLN